MITLPQSAKQIITTLKKAGFAAYAVGGSVRDLLLKRPTKSWDFTTNATPAHILDIFPESFYDNKFGTVGVKIKNVQDETEDIYEVTTYRSEKGYQDHRHPDEVLWGTTLEEDLSRRDFTINAIAYDGKKIIDPFGGQQDLQKKLVKTVGDPDARFSEDALRLMRGVRIATELGFIIEPQTFAAIQKNAPTLQEISADRIRNEFMKILASKYPTDGILLLKNTGLLNEFLPEIAKAFAVPQKSPGRHHVFDVGTHLVESLRHCSSTNAVVRFATLLHDIGKPVVFRKNEKSGLITFYNHEVVGASIAKNICLRLNFSNHDREKIETLVRWHQFTVDENQTDGTLRRFIKRVGKENLQDILDLRIGDRVGSGAAITSWRLRLYMKRLEEVQKQPFTVADLKIDGHDVMKLFNMQPGPMIGKILDELFNEVITDKVKNEREMLLKRLAAMKHLTEKN